MIKPPYSVHLACQAIFWWFWWNTRLIIEFTNFKPRALHISCPRDFVNRQNDMQAGKFPMELCTRLLIAVFRIWFKWCHVIWKRILSFRVNLSRVNLKASDGKIQTHASFCTTLLEHLWISNESWIMCWTERLGIDCADESAQSVLSLLCSQNKCSLLSFSCWI